MIDIGAASSRTWEIRGDDQLCFNTDQRDSGCYTLERNTADSSLYRVRAGAAVPTAAEIASPLRVSQRRSREAVASNDE